MLDDLDVCALICGSFPKKLVYHKQLDVTNHKKTNGCLGRVCHPRNTGVCEFISSGFQ